MSPNWEILETKANRCHYLEKKKKKHLNNLVWLLILVPTTAYCSLFNIGTIILIPDIYNRNMSYVLFRSISALKRPVSQNPNICHFLQIASCCYMQWRYSKLWFQVLVCLTPASSGTPQNIPIWITCILSIFFTDKSLVLKRNKYLLTYLLTYLCLVGHNRFVFTFGDQEIIS